MSTEGINGKELCDHVRPIEEQLFPQNGIDFPAGAYGHTEPGWIYEELEEPSPLAMLLRGISRDEDRSLFVQIRYRSEGIFWSVVAREEDLKYSLCFCFEREAYAAALRELKSLCRMADRLDCPPAESGQSYALEILDEPCSAEEFDQAVLPLLQDLEPLPGSFLTIALPEALCGLRFVQCELCDDRTAIVEVNLRLADGNHLFSLMTADHGRVESIFRTVCCGFEHPDLADWIDVTNEILG